MMTAVLESVVLAVLVFLSCVLWIGEPDLHDAMVKWAHSKIAKEIPCPKIP